MEKGVGRSGGTYHLYIDKYNFLSPTLTCPLNSRWQLRVSSYSVHTSEKCPFNTSKLSSCSFPSKLLFLQFSPFVHAKSFQLTLCNPIWTINLPGSFVHGILQARILEWVATWQPMPSFRGSLPTQVPKLHLLCLLHWQAGSLPLAPPEKSVSPSQ